MTRELKGYGLKATRKPAKHPLLSTTVGVRGKDGKRYYCYVSFAEKLVTAVGKKLPQGVSRDNPAYLLVAWDDACQHWKVYAVSADQQHSALLWSTADQPSWLNFYKIRG